MSEQPQTYTTTETYDEEEINLLELVRVVVRRKKLIIKICSVAIILSVCYSLTLKNTYTATATFYPPPRETAGSAFASLIAQTGALQGAMGGGLGGSADLYMGILKSRSVADAVVKRLDLQNAGSKPVTLEAARRRASASIKVAAGKDGIVKVDAKDKDPQKAALLANTFVDEMIRRSIQLYVGKAGSERYFLEKRLDVVKVDLKNAESVLKDFQEKNKTIKADAQASVAIEGIARVRAEIVSKEVQLATLRNSMTDESSDVKALQAAISRLKSQLGTLSGSGGGDNIIPATGNVPGIGVEYARRLRELKVQEAIFEQLTKQYETAKLNEAKESSPVQILDEAIAPSKKSGPKRSMMVILATFSAFILSVVIIFVQEYVSKLSPEDAEIISEIKQSLSFRKRGVQA
jgi:uncharacterized protein involved in exopolysaccharide biosynthesis